MRYLNFNSMPIAATNFQLDSTSGAQATAAQLAATMTSLTSMDLGILLGAWNSVGSVADLDGDGVVGATDLGVLLGAWGPCG